MTGDARRDLIASAPGAPGVTGTVYVIFGGPSGPARSASRTPEPSLAAAPRGTCSASLRRPATSSIPTARTRRILRSARPAPSAAAARSTSMSRDGASAPRKTTADATLTVLGAPGDQLGSALATGDLDKDGRRELIIGAPGQQPRLHHQGQRVAERHARPLDDRGVAHAHRHRHRPQPARGRHHGRRHLRPAGRRADAERGLRIRRHHGDDSHRAGHFVLRRRPPVTKRARGPRCSTSTRTVANDVVIGAPGSDGPGNARATRATSTCSSAP